MQIACWALVTVYLSFHDEWKAKAKAEVDSLVNKHTTNSSGEPLHQQLASIHVSAWEEEMPVLELIIRETLRISSNGLTFRCNLLEDLTISGGLVKPGDFVTYSLADVHLNPEIYSWSNEFDLARFTPRREEDKKGPYSYLGWGAGNFYYYDFFLLPRELMQCLGHHRTSSLHRNESCEIGNQGYSRFHACWFRVRRC